MIKERAIFILGAGASCDYGYPLGFRLADEICRADPDYNSEKRNYWGVPVSSVDGLPFSEEDVLHFVNEFWQSQCNSIDAFLEMRPKFTEVGKFAITAVLSAYENKQALFDLARDKSWYNLLLNTLLNAPDKQCFVKNASKITILTFNYDRSLEVFLQYAIQARYGLTAQETFSLLNNLEIIHLHGCIGSISEDSPNNNGGYREYGRRAEWQLILSSSRGIKLVHENDTSELNEIVNASLFNGVRYVFFFGLSYHELNMRLFRFLFEDMDYDETFQRAERSSRLILGTGYGMTDAERNRVQSRYNGLKISDPQLDCHAFLRHTKQIQNLIL
ncbi:hypothetical protein [Calycomorphotria hydatis]|uniref:SIR2-like domain-containing protein n=1 Tax=Calycomorphotria hydatis TaxID=2528027 RepID=A0A517T832_9PLAN|nr:hypothetical protein [Calycomorphotria hydatis]QDT64535.1 hypothetical protein V22_17700 [Calycomorphotria hydatis]